MATSTKDFIGFPGKRIFLAGKREFEFYRNNTHTTTSHTTTTTLRVSRSWLVSYCRTTAAATATAAAAAVGSKAKRAGAATKTRHRLPSQLTAAQR